MLRSFVWCFCTVLPLTLFLCVPQSQAAAIKLAKPTQSIKASKQIVWVNDNDLTPQEALSQLLQGEGGSVTSYYPSYGIVFHDKWFLLPIKNNSESHEWIVQAGRPYLNRVDAYLFNSQKELIDHQFNGGEVALDDRPVHHFDLLFPLQLPSGLSYLLMHVHSLNVLDLPVTLYTPKAFWQFDQVRNLWFGLVFGAIFILCLYNLLVFLSIRDKAYIYYVFYLGSLFMYMTAREGLGATYFWSDHPWWNAVSLGFFSYLAIGFAVLFIANFLQLGRYLPRLHRWRFHLAGVIWSLGIASLFFYRPLLMLSMLLIMVLPAIGLILGFYVLSRGYVAARYFILAFSTLACTLIVVGFEVLFMHRLSWTLQYALEASSLVEALLLSFALAHRWRVIEFESKNIQAKAQRRLQSEVRKRTRNLRQALAAKSQFLAVMSHEIRTPLNGILGTLDLLKDTSFTEKEWQHVNFLERSGKSLLSLVSAVLDYSRVDAEKVPINRVSFSLTELVEECRSLFAQQAHLKNNQLNTTLSQDAAGYVSGDMVRVHQILFNLVSNANKYCDNGEINITAKRSAQHAEIVEFTVEDTGLGIPTADKPHIFKAFHQSSNTTSGELLQSSGLGLAICKRLLDVMGGSIQVDSQEGEGTRFTILLPLPASNRPAPKHETSVPAFAEKRSGHLLIVDDNMINLEIAKQLCEKLGYQVDCCESGSEAIAVLIRNDTHYDAALLDCEMPVMDGFATSRRIIRLQHDGRVRRFPIAALTAHAVPDKVRECHEAGMVMHIAKPINQEKLAKAIDSLLGDLPS